MTPAGPLRAVVEELVRAGVHDAVICPGSRSTPMALALRAEPALRTWVHLDERAGAFFALGAAKASRRPVAILTTSGTAAVELSPAVVEAHEGRVPLVVLTADRPPELRDRGAPQAIDQAHLYGRFAKWFAELPVPEASSELEQHVRAVVGRAVATAAAAPAGPVHLDLPFREPLVPAGSLLPATGVAAAGDTPAPHAEVVTGARALPASEVERLAQRLVAAERGLIACGPIDVLGLPDAVARLAAATGFPLLADPLSGLRHGPHDRSHVIARYDSLLRSDTFRDVHAPDLVVRFGGTPVSKLLLETVKAGAIGQVVVDDGGWSEPTARPVTLVHAEPVGLAQDLAAAVEASRGGQATDTTWLHAWLEAERTADEAIETWLDALDEPFEGAVFADLEPALVVGSILFAGNSMPVRDMDAFLGGGPTPVRTMGNRGANGIDGLVSTALGAAAVGDGPVVAVVGDISLIHDLNALVAARMHGLSLTIVLVDNDGSGIFSFLPQAAADRPDAGLPDRFEELFGTPHGSDLGPVVEALGARHVAVGAGELADAVAASLGQPGVEVLHIRTDRGRNVELHRACAATVSTAVAAALDGKAGTG
jgi:2-succinyl-5-enolpyruvyl-6-hydroxy-3-cyclohexene-1-carboxylate synthase